MLLPTLTPIIIITLITCEISYKFLKYQFVEIAARSWKSDKVEWQSWCVEVEGRMEKTFGLFFLAKNLTFRYTFNF